MDPFSKKLLEELEQMQQHTGRILRSMSLSRMMPMEAEGWRPPVDIYESEVNVYVYVELAGVMDDSLLVTVEGRRLMVSGLRQLPPHPSIARIHQLELDLGPFQRTINLPSPVEADRVESIYTNGILMVILPKRTTKGKVQIKIELGE